LRLDARLLEALVSLLQMHTVTVRERRRAQLILNLRGLSGGLARVAEKMAVDVKTVRLWYRRAMAFNASFEEQLQMALGEVGHAGEKTRTIRLAGTLLQDAPRPGRPPVYSPKNYVDIMQVALSKPRECGRPITHWTARELADEVHRRNICTISERQVGRFLHQIDLKPHKCDYWLNPKLEEGHEQRVRTVCDTYATAATRPENMHIISLDEKTGMQAKERIHADRPMMCGSPVKLEFEYERHGTLCLIPSFDVATGRIMTYTINETRDEKDFTEHIAQTIANDLEAEWVFVLDQLNTHVSESLVRLVAAHIDYEGDLGQKGDHGALRNVATRRDFLSNPNHRIRFVYTPKHCSWLNQVEIWFGVLVRKVLRRGSFLSKQHLRSEIERFIDYFNRTMAKPYKWVYRGAPLRA
jgi:transposase